MKLYHHPFSSNARKPRMAALLLDLPVELEMVDLPKGATHKPEFLALNPNGKVPVLTDGDFVLWESHAIMRYMCAHKKGNTLYPEATQARATVDSWLDWCGSHWSATIAILNGERVIKKMFGGGAPDAAVVGFAEKQLERFSAVLNGRLGQQPFVAGPKLTLADLAIAAPMMVARDASLPLANRPHLDRWFAGICDLDAWKKTAPSH